MEGVAQLVAQHRLLGVVGQLEQVEAGGGSGKATTRLLLLDVEETFQDRPHCVARVLVTNKTAIRKKNIKYMILQSVQISSESRLNIHL